MGGQAEHRGVAIIGMSCRFPGANDPATFWQNLCNGVDSIRHFDETELLQNGVAARDLKHPDYVKASPVLDDIDRFDAGFFEYSPREARLMDPQQRLLLEIAWHAFEDAGYVPGEIAQRVGAFVGSGGVVSSYLLAQAALHGGTTGGVEHLANDKDFLSTKLSYKLGLTGPSVNVQTACSTALVATHMACQSILDGECEMAIAGGSVVRVPHVAGYVHRAGDILSPDGKCRAYDAKAEGTVFGSGAGVVVLKHVEDALADGDRIYAVILGSAVNNDGAEKLSYTASSTVGQQRAMDAAFAAAEVAPSTIGYVEGHGTGTVVGDPLEVEALRRCFAADQQVGHGSCYLGSVKTNIGHLEQAAGIASLIKTTLALYHRKIPESLNFDTPNPRMGLDETPFVVPTETKDWLQQDGPRRAAVNSLGLGGTNAFAVLQQAPAETLNNTANPPSEHILALSAHSKAALANSATKWQAHLSGLENDRQVAEACYSAVTRRKQFKYRLVVAGSNTQDLVTELAKAGEAVTAEPARSKLAFLFPGQGAQRAQMARQFHETEPSFRNAFDHVASRLRDKFQLDIEAAIFSPDQADKLNHTSVTQPALFAVEYALAAMLGNWGVRPDAVLGHSVGAYAALVVAGIYPLEAATDLIAHRARLMGELPEGGSMCALFTDSETAQEICDQIDGVSIATMNSPLSTVIAGQQGALNAAINLAEKSDIPARRLPVSHAFHSPLMKPALEPFGVEVEAIVASEPNLVFVSDMTGEVVEAAPNSAYLVEHILQPVNFAKGLQKLLDLGCTDFIEVGPGTALRSFTAAANVAGERLYGMLDEGGNDRLATAHSLAKLWERGYSVDLPSYYAEGKYGRTDIPFYPFDRQRYWLDDKSGTAVQQARNVAGDQIRLPGPSGQSAATINFQTPLSANNRGWLPHHKVYDAITLPVAAALVGFMEAAAPALQAGETIEVHDLTYQEACLIGGGGGSDGDGRDDDELVGAEMRLLNFEVPSDFTIGTAKLYGLPTSTIVEESSGTEDWHTHCEARLHRQVAEPRPVGNLQILQRQHTKAIKPGLFYSALNQLGLNYGPGFRNLQQIFLGEQSALGKVRLNPDLPKLDSPIHPALLDACLHLFPAATGEYGDFGGGESSKLDDLGTTTYLPITIEKFALYRDVPDEVWSHCRARPDDQLAGERYCVDVDIYADDGTLVATLAGLTIKQMSREEFLPAQQDQVPQWLYGVDWVAGEPLDEVASTSSPGHWLVVATDAGDVEKLLVALDEQGQTFELASPGQLLEPVEEAGFQPSTSINPLLGVINATALSARPLALLTPDQLCEETQVQFGLSQALLRLVTETLSAADVQPKIWYLTQGAQAPLDTHLGGEAIQAILWGHGRAIAQEHPNVWGGLIDIDDQTSGDQIVQELVTDGPENVEDQIALRGGGRFGPRLVRRKFETHNGPIQPPISS
ncbi:MAG: beta-ketoacyl synthase N-terminal-like domain-containing protein, partial [Rhizobiaceae bacterium]